MTFLQIYTPQQQEITHLGTESKTADILWWFRWLVLTEFPLLTGIRRSAQVDLSKTYFK